MLCNRLFQSFFQKTEEMYTIFTIKTFLLFLAERVRQIQERLEEFIKALNTERE